MTDWLAEPNFAGETLAGRYRILGELGRGGMGIVYQAWDVNLERLVVVKVPLARVLHEPNARKRFLLEMEQLRAVEHANVVWVLDCGQHDGVPYFVLQYLGGGNLADRMDESQDGTLPLSDLLPWLRTIAETLDHLHVDRAIVHRDVKPGNILFDGHGRVYLSDFGLVKTSAATGTDLTGTGMMPGSPAYMAPEQALGGEVTGAADQYALAVTVYEVLSGRLPFDGETPLEIVLEKKRDRCAPLCSLVPGLPAAAGAAVARAMSFEPRRRFFSCAAFAEAFESACGRPAGGGEPPRGGRGKRRRRRSARYRSRRRRRAFVNTLVLTSLLALALGIGIGFYREYRMRGPAPGPAPTREPARADAPDGVLPQPLDTEPAASAGAGAEERDPRPADPGRIEFPDGSLRSGTVPAIIVSAPLDGAVLSPLAIQVVGMVRNPREGGRLEVGGREITCLRGRIDYVLPPLAEADGPLDIDLRYQFPHEDGRVTYTTEASCRVILDGTPPEIRLNPLPAMASDLLVVSGRVTEEHLDRLEVNGVRCPVEEDGSFTMEVRLSGGGKLGVVVAATDAAGNGAIARRTVLRDAVEIEITSPAERAVIARREIVVAGRVAGPLAGLVVRGGVAREGQPRGTLPRVPVEEASGTFRFTATVVEDGVYVATLVVSGPNGTALQTAERTVVVDRTPPRFEGVEVSRVSDGLRITGRVRDAALERLTVNGDEVPVGPDGSFEATVPRSSDPILLLATDIAGWSMPYEAKR